MVGPAADNTAAPPFTFLGDLDTGYASSAANTLAMVAGGTTRLSVSTTFVTSTLPIAAPIGTAAAPSFVFSDKTNSGMFETSAGTGRMGWSVNGTQAAHLDGTFFYTNAIALDDTNADVILKRSASKAFTLDNDGAGAPLNSTKIFSIAGMANGIAANGQSFIGGTPQYLTELTTIAAAASTDTTIQMPATSVVLAVSVRVTTVIPTAASFTVGDSGSAARFSTAAVSTAATSTDPGTKAGAYYNASALSIRITPNAQPADNTGRVRVTIYYYTVTPPTS